MIAFLKDKLTDHFNKLLLAFLLVGTVMLTVHLIHRAGLDSGKVDGFIVWAETQSAFILGKLLGMMPADVKSTPGETTTTKTEKVEVHE